MKFHEPLLLLSPDSCQPVKLPCMPGGKHSPPLPPKKVMICVPPGVLDSTPTAPSSTPLSALSQKCAPSHIMSLHHGTLLPSQLAGLSGLHQSHGHPFQLQYGSLHASSRIIEELNKTLALSMQRLERSVLMSLDQIVPHSAKGLWISLVCRGLIQSVSPWVWGRKHGKHQIGASFYKSSPLKFVTC